MKISRSILQIIINENITLPRKITSVRKLKKFIKKEHKRTFKCLPMDFNGNSFLSYIWTYYYQKFNNGIKEK